MRPKLQLREISIYTRGQTYHWAFAPGATLIHGPVGTGKSSFLELIKFGLGGKAVLTPAVREEVDSVSLAIEFARGLYTLRRQVDSSSAGSVMVTFPGEDAPQPVPISGRESQRTLSDFLLHAMGLPSLRIPRTRNRPGIETSPISFNDILTYLYVEQSEVDRSIAKHREPYRTGKRRAVFELLAGLATPETLKLETQIGELRGRSADLRERIETVDRFTTQMGFEDVDSLMFRAELLRNTADSSKRELKAVKSGVSGSTSAIEELRAEVLRMSGLAEERDKHYRKARADVEALTRRSAQIDLDLQRTSRSTGAVEKLGSLHFVECPNCLQGLDRPVHEGHCPLCTQQVDLEPVGVFGDRMMQRLLVEQEEIKGLLKDALAAERIAKREYEKSLDLLQAERQRLDDATRDTVSPLLAAVEVASSSIGKAEAQLAQVQEQLRVWDELGLMRAEQEELESRLAATKRELTDIRSMMPDRTTALGDLSHIYSEIVSDFDVPWAEDVSIDHNDYLPRIGGDSLDTVAVSGGAKTLYVVAYHLALLTYSGMHGVSALPLFLMLDSPRKNLGQNPDDQQRGERIYRRIRRLCDTYGDDIQFVIADNDLPLDRSWLRGRELSYNEPLIAHRHHPGPAAVRAGTVERIGGGTGDALW